MKVKLSILSKIQSTSVNPNSINSDLRQKRIKLVVQMILYVFLYKNLRFIRIF